MEHKRRIAVVLAALAAAVALPVTAVGAKPVEFEHAVRVASPPEPGDWCGAVDGVWSGNATYTFRLDAQGAFHATSREQSFFTANGKTIELDAVGVDMGTGVENGDGTITFTEHTAGLAVTIRIADGPILKDANGKPLIGAGTIDSVATFDMATGELVSYSETVHGPHPLRDGVDICTPATVYLTS
jgi:hypothetical protein